MRAIVITGASSGIGAALALDYAGPDVTLGLMGRNESRLAAVTSLCRKRGAIVFPGLIDLRDRVGMAQWIAQFDEHTPIDLMIANAGVMAGTPHDGEIESPHASMALIDINVGGTLNAVQSAIAPMMNRGRGQIVLISSIAAFGPVPDAPSYAASKAALMNYGLSLRALLGPRGIRVNVVCPGYVITPMMRREAGPKPFAITAEKAAALIRRGLERDRAVITFPKLFGLVSRISGLLPGNLRMRAARSLRFTVTTSDRSQDGSGSKSSA